MSQRITWTPEPLAAAGLTVWIERGWMLWHARIGDASTPYGWKVPFWIGSAITIKRLRHKIRTTGIPAALDLTATIERVSRREIAEMIARKERSQHGHRACI